MREMNKTPIKIMLDVVADFMKLDEKHCYVYNQKWITPKDGKICVAGSQGATKIIAHNQSHKKLNNAFMEELNLREMQTIDFNIFGYFEDVLYRYQELIMSLKTDKARNIFEKNGFFVADLPENAMNFNETDGTKILYRYIISFNVFLGKNIILESENFAEDNFMIKAKD
jgi:hypothetical protein